MTMRGRREADPARGGDGGRGPGADRGGSWAAVLWPAVASAALATAVAVAPFPLAGLGPGGGYAQVSELASALGAGVVRSWATGAHDPAVMAAVDFWARFHVVKATLAAALLGALAVLAARVARVHPGRAPTWWRPLVGGLVLAGGLLALLVLVANIQGALVPLTSALGLLPVRAPGPALGATLDAVRASLAAGRPSPSAAALVGDFTAYHQVMAWLGASSATVLAGGALVAWRRAGSTRRRITASAICTALATGFVVVAAANAATAADPVPALLAFLAGGL